MSQESPSTPVAEIVDELGSGAQLVDEGEFTLDPVRAREKLRSYQLADPNGYLLLLVEAGCLAAPSGRAPELRFTLGRTHVCEFLSLELGAGELEQLLGGVFRSLEGLEGEALARARTLRLLGLALNAALALPVEHVSVEFIAASGQGRGTRFFPAGASEPVEATHAGSTRGRVRFQLEFSTFENLSIRDERELLHERCRYAPFLVELEGERIDQGMDAGLDYGGTIPHPNSKTEPVRLEGEAIGIASKRSPEGAALLLLVTRGVLAPPIELEGMRPGFRALVYADLRKDLAQARVIHDERYEALLAAVADAHEQLPDLDPSKPWDMGARAEADERHDQSWFKLVALVVTLFVVFALWLMSKRDPPEDLEQVFDSPRASTSDPRAKLHCDRNQPEACIERAQYALELGTPASVREAEELLNTACGVEREACKLRRTLSGPFVAGQRWRGGFGCDGAQLPVVLDVAADTNTKGLLRYRLDGVMYVVGVSLSAQGDTFRTHRPRWIAPASMRKQGGGQPSLEGRFGSSTRISGDVINKNCSRFEMALESGAVAKRTPRPRR